MQIGSSRNSKLLHKYKFVHILFCLGSGGSGGSADGGRCAGGDCNGSTAGVEWVIATWWKIQRG